MKIERVSDHIYGLKIWFIIPIHVWIVVEPEGLTLVDAGISPMTRGILRFIEGLGAGPLKRILLTHGHMDHVGAVTGLRKIYPVEVRAHKIEIPYLEGHEAYPRRKSAAASLPAGLVTPLAAAAEGKGLSHRPFEKLAPVAGLTPYLTPGHSPGHVVYYHEEDRVLLAGDLFTSRRGKLRRPMAIFTADMREALESSRLVDILRPDRLEVCHGNPVMNPAEQLASYRSEEEKRLGVRGSAAV